MINTAEAKVLLVGDRYLDLVATHSRRELNAAQSRRAAATARPRLPRLADLIAAAEPDEAEAEVEDEDVSVLMYTSGTTSLPKGVMLRFRDFAAYVTANVEMADGTERGVALVCVPFYHIAGTTAMMTNIWTGRKLIVMPQFDAKAWLELVAREHVTHAFVVPTMMKQLLDEPAFAKTDFSNLTNLAYGGARDADAGDPPRDRGVPENCRLRQRLRPDRDHLVADRARPRRPSDRRHAGADRAEAQAPQLDRQAAARRRNRVRDDDGKFLAHGQVGEILIRTPRIMKGYAGREDDSAPARRMARDRRPRMGRRRRLRLLRRPQGRHDHPRRREYRARRNRNRPDEPSGDRRGGGDRRAVGRMGPDRQGLRRACGRVRTSPTPEHRGVLPHAPGELQAARVDRVHRRAAEESARQNPAQGAARTTGGD